jgi:dihydroorotate dehydrogenase electron transfer subunit
MKQLFAEVSENKRVAEDTYRMVLRGDISADEIKPGSFINIKLPEYFLRRPISVCDAGSGFITIVYRIAGKGTETMAELTCGEKLDILAGLGKGFDLSEAGDDPLLIGGGIGSAPLYLLAKRLVEAGHKTVNVLMGFRSGKDSFNEDAFRGLGCRLKIMTEDGSLGTKGFVTDGMPKCYSFFYACGPIPMLESVYQVAETDGEFSLEERMGCGFGACMGCTVKTRFGPKRVCSDGPVFRKEELTW